MEEDIPMMAGACFDTYFSSLCSSAAGSAMAKLLALWQEHVSTTTRNACTQLNNREAEVAPTTSPVFTILYFSDMDTTAITTPTLVLDPARARHNLSRLATKVSAQHIRLRPHFKTHQSRMIGEWFRDESISAITVSSVGMARYFAENGWQDITIAFPCPVRQLEEIQLLAKQSHPGLVVLDPDTVDILGRSIPSPLRLWIKIDVGTHRTGIDPNHTDLLDAIAERISHYPQLSFGGFLAHAGHTYQSRSAAAVQRHHDLALSLMWEMKNRYRAAFPDIEISLGDTPGASMLSSFGDVDELRPGNFIFYDLMQHEIGACHPEDIAVAMACPVVAVHPERLQWIVYGGAIHFSKDHLRLSNGQACYGRMVEWSGENWSADPVMSYPHLISLSQEHGVVQCTQESFHRLSPGDLAFFLPVHSCLTADCMGGYLSLDGKAIDHYRRCR